MAQTDVGDSAEAVSLSSKLEKKPLVQKSSFRIPRRTLTLINITFLLNVLLWSSIICIGITIYQIVSDPRDATTIPSQVLTASSAAATIFYTIFHTILSLKQRRWKSQRRDISAMQKTYHFAVRVAVTMCIFWLLTCGWNMIIVARRPLCLDESPGLQTWEVGIRCKVTRVSIALAMVALCASMAIFIMLATVRRPFEAHIFKCVHEQPTEFNPSPGTSRNASPRRRGSPTKQRHVRGESTSTQQSNCSETDIETLDLNGSRPNSIYAVAPQQAVGLSILTSSFSAPFIPLAYATPPRTSSLVSPPPLFPPPLLPSALTRPPRLAGPNPPPVGPLPKSLAPQFAASSLRAIHPIQPIDMRSASRSNPHLPSAAFSYHGLHSRSTMSLTVPQRLSTAMPADSMAYSLRSGSTRGRESQASSRPEDYPFVTPSESPTNDKKHFHNLSVEYIPTLSLPDVTLGAEEIQSTRTVIDSGPMQTVAEIDVTSGKLDTIRSSSAHILEGSNSGNGPESQKSSIELERNRARVMKELPFRRSKSVDPIQMNDAIAGAASIAEAAAAMMSKMPADMKTMPKTRKLHSQPMNRNRVDYDDVKNKPLPKIAIL